MSAFWFETPLGALGITWSARGLTALLMAGETPPEPSAAAPDWVREAAGHIRAYLEGEREGLADLPIDLSGQPPFRRRCLEALRATRPGGTLTYAELATRAGSPGAARAAGQAVKRNPLPILVPCHRVVASDGPGGFSFGAGLATKARLLALEGRHTGGDDDAPAR